jgi:hypothetical protein
VIVSDFLVLYFGSPSSPSSFLDVLFEGNNVEKLKKWKAVEHCMEERWKEEPEEADFAVFVKIIESWVNLLSHALLDINVSC